MAKEKKQEFVTHITPRDEDFSQWYTDVILKTELCDYAPVRGCMIVRPYGYAIWERIQAEMDKRFKETGHQNVYFPMLIPESLLLKEAEHVEGFAPEVAWVTQGGTEKLQERLAVRPTSETIFCTMYAKWVQTWRDLPMKYNQWCSVMRWEKATRPFLRTSEFLWQEGHTIHATAEEAQEETMQMLHVYQEVAENVMALPVYVGQKSEKEKFAGARATYSMEAMMQDGKALQAGTSHFLGQNFAKSANISFVNKNNQQEYAYTSSWGVSTRLIGGVIMTHADDEGMVVPPKIAPYQIVIVPVIKNDADEDAVMEYIKGLQKELLQQAPFGEKIRIKIDKRDRKSVDKFWEWTRKGAPVILEIGPRDVAEDNVMVKERLRLGTPEGKAVVKRDEFVRTIAERLEKLQKEMFAKARARLEKNVRTDIKTKKEFEEYFANSNVWIEEGKAGKVAFVRGKWSGDPNSEELLKAMKITIRCIPFDQSGTKGECLLTGKQDAEIDVIYARSY